MLDGYSVLIKRKESQAIGSYYYPDFDYAYELDEESDSSNNDCTSILVAYIQELKAQRKAIPFPQSLKKHQAIIPTNFLDQWSVCFVDSKFISGFWESVLPRFGVFSSLMTAATMGMIDFLTIKTSVSSTEGTNLGIMGAVYSGLMTLIIYYFSNASDFSRQVGRSLDDYLSGLIPLHATSPNESQAAWLPNVMKALLTTIPVFTTFISSYTHFNQVGAIGEKLHRGDLISPQVFNAINVVMIIFSIYSKFFFQVSFLPSLYASIDERFKCSSSALCHGRKVALFSQNHYERVDESISTKKNQEGGASFSTGLVSYGTGFDE